jgi:hypothetical protein
MRRNTSSRWVALVVIGLLVFGACGGDEADRLPVDVRLRLLVDGRPSDLDDDVGGSMDLEVEVRNSTSATTLLPSAIPAEPERAANVLDSIGTALVSGKRRRPGRDFPATIPVVTPIVRESVLR